MGYMLWNGSRAYKDKRGLIVLKLRKDANGCEVNFPNLKLPTNVAPWDTLHRTVSKKNIHVMNFFFAILLILTETDISMYLSQ